MELSIKRSLVENEDQEDEFEEVVDIIEDLENLHAPRSKFINPSFNL